MQTLNSTIPHGAIDDLMICITIASGQSWAELDAISLSSSVVASVVGFQCPLSVMYYVVCDVTATSMCL